MARSYCFSCGVELEDAASLAPICDRCQAELAGRARYFFVMREGARADGPLTEEQVAGQIKTGLLAAWDRVGEAVAVGGGEPQRYRRLEKHPVFAPWFTPGDRRFAVVVGTQDQARALSRTRLRQRVVAVLSPVLLLGSLVHLGWTMVRFDFNPLELPLILSLRQSGGEVIDGALVTVKKAVDPSVAEDQLAQAQGLPGEELITALQAQWPQAAGGPERVALAQTYLLRGTVASFEDARRELEVAVAAKPKDVEALAGLALVYAELGAAGDAAMGERSVQIWRRAMELDPKAPAVIEAAPGLALAGRSYDEAIKRAEECLGQRPESALCAWYLGGALVGAGRHDEALDALSRAKEALPDAPIVTLAYGRASLEGARYAEAERVLVDYAKRFPDDVGVLGLLTRLHREQGRFERAVESARRAQKARPDDAGLKMTIGQLLFYGLNDAKAAADLLLPLAEDKQLDVLLRREVMLTAAQAATAAGRLDDAQRVTGALVDLAPQWPPGALARAELLAARGDISGADAALRLADTAELGEREAARYHLRVAALYTRLGRDRLAQDELEAAREAQPESILPRYALAAHLLRTADPRGAARELLKTATMDVDLLGPRDPVEVIPYAPPSGKDLARGLFEAAQTDPSLADVSLQAALALLESQACLVGAGDCIRAEQLQNVVLTQSPTEPSSLLLMGQLLLRRGDAAGAFERLGQLSGDVAESGLALALRALAGAQADKASEAVKLAQRAESAAPNDPGVKALVAQALWAMGERDQALALARAALALDPHRTSLRRWLGDSR